MNDVIERLRASKAVCEVYEYDEGWHHGHEWATKSASYRELRNLAQREFGLQFPSDPLALEVDRVIGPEGGEESFWRDFDDGLPSDRYAEGFIEGASEVWKEVVDEL